MRVAIVGLGFMGLTHLKAYRRIEGAEITAISSNDPRVLAGDLSHIQGNLDTGSEPVDISSLPRFGDAMECIRSCEADAVDLCLPTAMHAPAAMEALRRGLHVLVEKPMALDATECEAMIAAARQSRRVLMTAQVLRFFPAYLPLIGAVRDGSLGAVRHALFRRRCAAPKWGAWLTDKKASGGGVFDLLIHDVDMALVCFGTPAAVSATGHEDLAAGIDMVTGQLHYESGLAVTITGGWHLPSAYPFSMEYTVVGEEAAIEYSSAGRPPHWYGREKDFDIPLETKDGYQAEIEYFVECCRTGAAPERCSPESSAAAVRVARLLDEARSKKGEAVPCL